MYFYIYLLNILFIIVWHWIGLVSFTDGISSTFLLNNTNLVLAKHSGINYCYIIKLTILVKKLVISIIYILEQINQIVSNRCLFINY